MKIIVLMGSPNKNGSTVILVDSFVQGAAEAGHGCEVIDICRANIHPCTGCVRCGYDKAEPVFERSVSAWKALIIGKQYDTTHPGTCASSQVKHRADTNQKIPEMQYG